MFQRNARPLAFVMLLAISLLTQTLAAQMVPVSRSTHYISNHQYYNRYTGVWIDNPVDAYYTEWVSGQPGGDTRLLTDNYIRVECFSAGGHFTNGSIMNPVWDRTWGSTDSLYTFDVTQSVPYSLVGSVTALPYGGLGLVELKTVSGTIINSYYPLIINNHPAPNSYSTQGTLMPGRYILR